MAARLRLGFNGAQNLFVGSLASIAPIVGTTLSITGTSTFNNDVTINGDLDMRGNSIINVAEPANPQDAATMNYVDTATTSTLTTFSPALADHGGANVVTITTFSLGTVGTIYDFELVVPIITEPLLNTVIFVMDTPPATAPIVGGAANTDVAGWSGFVSDAEAGAAAGRVNVTVKGSFNGGTTYSLCSLDSGATAGSATLYAPDPFVGTFPDAGTIRLWWRPA